MEKNIPGLKKAYNAHFSRLRANRPSKDEATRDLMYWSAKYLEAVLDGVSFDPASGLYGGILEAYARREALKQYIEEVKADADRTI